MEKSAYLEKNCTIADTKGARHVDMIMINDEHTRSQGFLRWAGSTIKPSWRFFFMFPLKHLSYAVFEHPTRALCF